MNIFKRIMVVGIILTTLGALSGCGTVHGVGQDISGVGHALQRS